MQTAVATDLPARLRLAITRSARRLRQEADAGLSPSLTAALATGERCSSACAPARTLTWPSGSAASTTRSSPPSKGPRRFSSACSRMLSEGVRAQARETVRLSRRTQLPALLRRTDRLAERQLDADGRRAVARAHAHRQPARGGSDDC